ncbi:MAG: helix-turn-helix transcriptional regulator [Oscillospiraceae bacterium]|nr:helix-turn-helix transcriptional regulator [Oscillospiraceae bacterium]
MFGHIGIAEFLILFTVLIRYAAVVVIAVLLIKALLKYLNSDKKGNPVIKKSLGQVIKSHREAKGYTQEYIAEQLGVSRQAVSKWENGTTEPSTSNLFALAKLFDMPIEEFMKEIQI